MKLNVEPYGDMMGLDHEIPSSGQGPEASGWATAVNQSSVSRQIIEDALGGFYKPESILAKDVQRIGLNSCGVTFVFPNYERTVSTMGHVSGVQIQAALLEALYCAVAYSIREGTFPANTTLEDFRSKRAEFILARQDISFRRMLNEGDTGEIRVEIQSLEDTKYQREFKKLIFKVSGIIRGTIECLLEVPGAEMGTV